MEEALLVSIIVAHFPCCGCYCLSVGVSWCSAYVFAVSVSCWLKMCWCFMHSFPTVLWPGWSENAQHCYHLYVWYTASLRPSWVKKEYIYVFVYLHLFRLDKRFRYLIFTLVNNHNCFFHSIIRNKIITFVHHNLGYVVTSLAVGQLLTLLIYPKANTYFSNLSSIAVTLLH